jgi:hypothetical protein
MLLTAVAAAFSASSEAIEQSDTFFRASQAARVSMNQILTEGCAVPARLMRSTKHRHRPAAMVGHDGNPRDWVIYDAQQDAEVDTHTPKPPRYTLASNCTNTTFTYDIVSGQGDTRLGDRHRAGRQNTIRLTGSAAPRKVQTWQ